MPRFESIGAHLFIVVLALLGYFKLQIDLLALFSPNIALEKPDMHLALPVSAHLTRDGHSSKNGGLFSCTNGL